MKRKLAALLAGAMVLTSLPMVSFAATDGRVSYKPTVKKDTEFTYDNAPRLIIEEKDLASEDISGSTARLSFKGAEWKGGDESTANDETVLGFAYEKLPGGFVEITFGGSAGVKDTFEIPLVTKVTEEGEAEVTIEPVSQKTARSEVTAASYVFAIVGSGSTKTTLSETNDFPDELEVGVFLIDELKANSMPRNATDKKIKLSAPQGFEWSFKDVASKAIENASLNYGSVALSDEVTGAGDFKDNVDNVSVSYPLYGRNDSKVDKEIIEIEYDNVTPETQGKGSIIIEDLVLTATEDAEFGDVNVEISGDDITTETIKVGAYVEYGVNISVEDDEKVLFSGRYESKDDGKLLKLTIEEGVVDSWWAQRNTTIEFPKGIKVRDVKVSDAGELAADSEVQKDDTLADNAGGLSLNKNKDIITLNNIEINDEKKGKVELEIWVSIEADFEGDIVAVVGGPALDEDTEVVLGQALVPIKAAFESTELQVGYKELEVATIEIIEAKEGALQRGKTLAMAPENMYFEDDFEIEVEVTAGDLQIGDVDYDNGILEIDIKRASKEASTITISGSGIYTSRALAEGSYDLEVAGDAIIENDEDIIGEEGFQTDCLAFEEFINVITPAPHKGEAGGAVVQAKFTVGATEYVVGDQVAYADAAPYIKDGRTMIPIKYAAFALGVEPQNIKWDQATKTATILGDRVIQVKVGSKDLVVNGAVLQMDTAAEVVDGRTFLPISWVASALNVPYTWDDASKTVSFN